MQSSSALLETLINATALACLGKLWFVMCEVRFKAKEASECMDTVPSQAHPGKLVLHPD